MFVCNEAEKSFAVALKLCFKDVIAVVGSLSDDTLLVERTRREEYRERFGFRPGDTVVFVTSPWGPQSLFQHMGDVFLAEA